MGFLLPENFFLLDVDTINSVGFPLPGNFCQPGKDTVNSVGFLLSENFCQPEEKLSITRTFLPTGRETVHSVGFPLPGNFGVNPKVGARVEHTNIHPDNKPLMSLIKPAKYMNQ